MFLTGPFLSHCPPVKSDTFVDSQKFKPFLVQGKVVNVVWGMTGETQKGSKEHRWGAPYREQLRILFTRTIKTRRFEALSTRDFIQFLIVGVLAGKLAACVLWILLTGML